jgi:predicted nucleic acid-binding Zn ribbon protein
VERLGGEIKRELSRFGAQGGMPELLEAWPGAVGEMVAANAWPARIARDGTLHVNTSSSAWAFELAQLAPAIAERLRQELGEGAPKALRFAVGHLPEPAVPEDVGRRTEVPEPGTEALQRAAELTAGIADEELRKSVQRAVALGLSQPPSDLPF